MPLVHRCKLRLSQQQEQQMCSWLPMLRGMENYALADRIDSYNQGAVVGEHCLLWFKAPACPLICSVARSASMGDPWREDNPNLRRSRVQGDYCDLATRQEKTYQFNPRRSAYEMQSSQLKTLKKARPWYKQLNFDVMQQALRHLDKAFTNFFEGRANFPRFKSRDQYKLFEFKPGTVKLKGRQITFPTLGTMRFYQSRPINSEWKIRTVTVTQEADGWYASILFHHPSLSPPPLKSDSELQTVNGVDRGIKKIVAQATGEVTLNPKIGKRFERRLRIRQRRLSRKKNKSNNRAKAKNRLARVHQKIRRVREDFQWKEARRLAVSADVIGFEDLNIKGMKSRCKPKKDVQTGKYLKNGQKAKSQLNKAIADAAWYSLKVKTQQQAAKLGNWVVEVPAHHSLQECSNCGYVSPTNREQEKFICEGCGHYADADIDAAVVIAKRTIKKLGIVSLRVVSPEVMPNPESTGNPDRKERRTANMSSSSPKKLHSSHRGGVRGGGEPGNQPKKREQDNATSVQLSLFDDEAFTVRNGQPLAFLGNLPLYRNCG